MCVGQFLGVEGKCHPKAQVLRWSWNLMKNFRADFGTLFTPFFTPMVKTSCNRCEGSILALNARISCNRCDIMGHHFFERCVNFSIPSGLSVAGKSFPLLVKGKTPSAGESLQN